MSNLRTFKRVGGLRPGRSVFDLSYEKKFTCDMGQLIPICCDEMVPGDVFTIGSEILARAMPLVSPIMHEINIYTHWYFVPYRLLWNEWESFITGGRDGNESPPLPTWPMIDVAINTPGYLWDYMGFPVGVKPAGKLPLDFPRRAYYFIYDEYYKDPTLHAGSFNPADLHDHAQGILNRCWEKDYFTSALPWQQRGAPISVPIAGNVRAEWQDDISLMYRQYNFPGAIFSFEANKAADTDSLNMIAYGASSLPAGPGRPFIPRSVLNNNTVGELGSFDIAYLRFAFQVQKWLERNARAGFRYTEFLRSHFGVAPRDERLDRPEYIGGSKTPLIISEVLQTSSTDSASPQGNMAGHGITVGGTRIGTYRAYEFGLIMGLMSIMPKPAYSQGIDRQWLRETKYDYYFPEFANLSEQAIYQAEIMASNNEAENNRIFGYQGRYDEMRYKRNMVCGLMRSDFAHWHLGRFFSNTAPPRLNSQFVECWPDKRIFEVPSEPGFVVTAGNLIRAVRPMPIMSNPGLIDHH